MPWLPLPPDKAVARPETRAQILSGLITMLKACAVYMHSLAAEEVLIARQRGQDVYKPAQSRDDESLARHYLGIVRLQDWPQVKAERLKVVFSAAAAYVSEAERAHIAKDCQLLDLCRHAALTHPHEAFWQTHANSGAHRHAALLQQITWQHAIAPPLRSWMALHRCRTAHGVVSGSQDAGHAAAVCDGHAHERGAGR
jgi:hypothetical protein